MKTCGGQLTIQIASPTTSSGFAMISELSKDSKSVTLHTEIGVHNKLSFEKMSLNDGNLYKISLLIPILFHKSIF